MTTSSANGRIAGRIRKDQTVRNAHDASDTSDTSACTLRRALPLSRGFGSLCIVLVLFVGVAVGAKIADG